MFMFHFLIFAVDDFSCNALSIPREGTEDEQLGSVKCCLYVHLFRMAGPIPATLLTFFVGLVAVGCQVAADRILAFWSVTISLYSLLG